MHINTKVKSISKLISLLIRIVIDEIFVTTIVTVVPSLSKKRHVIIAFATCAMLID